MAWLPGVFGNVLGLILTRTYIEVLDGKKLSAPLSVAFCGRGWCICHTWWWCSQSRCSRWCGCRILRIRGPTPNLFSLLWGKWHCHTLFRTVWVWVDHVKWCGRQGSWSSRPPTLQPHLWMGTCSQPLSPIVHDGPWSYWREVAVLAPHC
jgi:hypothetical protein